MYLIAIVREEEGHYVALCPELDVVSQGDSIEKATENLKEAVELLLECACDDELRCRLKSQVYVTHFEARVGEA